MRYIAEEIKTLELKDYLIILILTT